MLSILFLLLSAVVAVQTKPKQETFVPFLTTQRKLRLGASPGSATASTGGAAAGGGVAGWFTRNIIEPLAGGPRIPEHTVTDYSLFLLATLNDGSGQYLGMFQQWWVISELQEVSGTGNNVSLGRVDGGASANGDAFEAQAEGQKQEAIQAKIKKDYHGAARAYVEAAKLYQKSGSQINVMEAAGAYEDAFKAYNMIKQSGPAIQCLENAATLFRSNDRGGSRAAKIYNQLGDLLKGQDAKKAAEMYREAAELFKSDGDGRALHATIRQAEQLCALHEYSQAFSLYNETIIPETMSQNILQYTTRDHILNAIIAHLGATQGDWIVFESDLEHFEDICLDFRSSRGRTVLRSLARAEREHDAVAFQESCQEFDRLQTGGMADWQVGLLLEEKKKLEDGDLL
ncbi:soluble NSF attachment protein [Dissophora ornata]|nr:soluble NSF attachment protein [Dissophora ornata]